MTYADDKKGLVIRHAYLHTQLAQPFLIVRPVQPIRQTYYRCAGVGDRDIRLSNINSQSYHKEA